MSDNNVEPVAWGIDCNGHFFGPFPERADADEWVANNGHAADDPPPRIFGLWDHPPLTDVEREAVAWADSRLRFVDGPGDRHVAATLRGLLERTKGGKSDE